MTMSILSLIFAVVWVAISGSASLVNFVFGFLIGSLALFVVRGEIGAAGHASRLGRILSLLALFFKELALSAIKVALLVTKRDMPLKPGIFAFPLTVDRDLEITLLANLITLTPGTLSVDVSEDRKFLYVHALDCSDVETTKREIAEGFERKILEAFR